MIFRRFVAFSGPASINHTQRLTLLTRPLPCGARQDAAFSTAGSVGAADAAMVCAARSAWRTISGTAVISHNEPWQSGPSANSPGVGCAAAPRIGRSAAPRAQGYADRACSRPRSGPGSEAGRDRAGDPCSRRQGLPSASPFLLEPRRRKREAEAFAVLRSTPVTWPRSSTARPLLNSSWRRPCTSSGRRWRCASHKGRTMAQEARLLLDRQALPDLLERGAQAVDDRLPRRAVRLCRGAGDARLPVRLDTRLRAG